MTWGSIDLSMPASVAVALLHSLLFPLWLWASGRVAAIEERHALRFLGCAVLLGAAWLGTVLFFVPAARATLADLATGLAVILGALLFYLEVWGLMTRGYTLGILITLQKAGRPLTAQEIFDGYRDGEGLGWIMRHRLGGLCASGFIDREGDRLTLAAGKGVFIARLYRFCVAVLGLRRTG